VSTENRVRREWLVEARRIAGLTQDELAQKLWVSIGAVCHWETGRTVPGGPTRKLLALYLSLPEDIVARGFEDGTEEEPAGDAQALEGVA